MSGTQHIAQAYIKINGQHIDPKHMEKLMNLEVDDSLHLPDMFSIHMSDPGLEMINAEVFKVGDSIEILFRIEAGPQGQPQSQVSLMKGEVTAIETDFNASQRTTFTVRGYDRSHRLHRARKTKTYLQVSDSDIASQLAGGAGLSADADSTSGVYPFVMQANQTDWEFLQERAARIGYRVTVEDKTLSFKKPPASPPEVELKWGMTLERFQARMTTAEQPDEVVVYGWDPKKKSAIVGKATSPTGNLQNHKAKNSSTGSATVASAFSIKGRHALLNQGVYTQSEADTLAQATLDKMASGFMQAEGHAGGNPAITAGSAVNIKDVGTHFSGKYMVTRALHRYSMKGYTTQFWCSGSGNMTLTELLSGNGHGASNGAGKGGSSTKPTAVGLMIGIVTNNQDPDNMGRVKVKFPSLGQNEGQDIESHWCRMTTIMAGPGQGVAYFPEANDEVVVSFLNGDPTQGYVLGAVWNGNDNLPKPPSKLVTGSLTIRRVQRSRLGHEIVLDDSPDPTQGIEIIDKTEKNYIKIVTQDNKIKIYAEQDIEVKSTRGNISVKTDQGNIDVATSNGNVSAKTSSGNVSVEASTGKTDITSMQDITLKSNAGKVSITGTAGVDITSPAQTSVKGMASLDLTSGGVTSVKGSMVSLGM